MNGVVTEENSLEEKLLTCTNAGTAQKKIGNRVFLVDRKVVLNFHSLYGVNHAAHLSLVLNVHLLPRLVSQLCYTFTTDIIWRRVTSTAWWLHTLAKWWPAKPVHTELLVLLRVGVSTIKWHCYFAQTTTHTLLLLTFLRVSHHLSLLFFNTRLLCAATSGT